jgi:hypothetical protein
MSPGAATGVPSPPRARFPRDPGLAASGATDPLSKIAGLSEADRFVDQHHDLLAARPLWLFSVGAFGDTKRLLGALTHKEPKRITEVRSAVQPREYGVFKA